MVDLYGQVLDDPDAPDALKTQAENLGNAYTASDDSGKVSAMASIWGAERTGVDYLAALVMTARAAALIDPSSDYVGQADGLIASMLTAGLDRSAARWSNIVSGGSLGWALVTLGAPGRVTLADYGDLDEFYGNDDSVDGHKSALLLAGLAGLGRVESGAQSDFADDQVEEIKFDHELVKALFPSKRRSELLEVSVVQSSTTNQSRSLQQKQSSVSSILRLGC
jgi:hypothetical protein